MRVFKDEKEANEFIDYWNEIISTKIFKSKIKIKNKIQFLKKNTDKKGNIVFPYPEVLFLNVPGQSVFFNHQEKKWACIEKVGSNMVVRGITITEVMDLIPGSLIEKGFVFNLNLFG